MARYKLPLWQRVKNDFGRTGTVKLVDPKTNTVVHTFDNPDAYFKYYNPSDPKTENNRATADKLVHIIDPKITPDDKAAFKNIKSATDGYKELTKRMTGKTVNVGYSKPARNMLGNNQLFDKDWRKTKIYANQEEARRKLVDELNRNRTAVAHRIPDKLLIDVARRKDAKRYAELMGLDEYNNDYEKANAIRDFIDSRSLKLNATGPDKYAAVTLWEAAKEHNDPIISAVKNDYGFYNFEKVDSKYRRNLSRPGDVNKVVQRKVNRVYGTGDDKTRDIFNEIKRDRRWSDHETARYLQTDEGKKEYYNKLQDRIRENKIKHDTANRILKKLDIPGQEFSAEKMSTLTVRSEREQNVEIGHILGFKGASAGQRDIAKLLRQKMSDNHDALKAMREGDHDEIRKFLPNAITYNEIHSFKGKDPRSNEIKSLQGIGIDVTGLPDDLQAKVDGSFYKPSGVGRGRQPSSGSGSRGGGSGSRGSSYGGGKYTKGGSLLGSEEITYVGGRAVLRKKQGRIGAALSGAGGSIKSRIKPKKKDVNKIIRDLESRNDLKGLTKEEIRYAAHANPVKRRQIIERGRKMDIDPGYKAKMEAKRAQRQGIYEAKLKGILKENERRSRAAQSPWWKAWYTLTHNLFVLIGVVVAISIIFLPIGMFHVVGWAIAVGIVSLIMYVIWVFIELWFLIAQALTAVINLVAQAIIGILNYVGQAVAGALGQSFTPFEHSLVQNMQLVEIDPATGKRTILGITWGQWNLVPPDFLKLNEFMPTSFDTDTILAKIFPAIRDFFTWYTGPIAERYTEWISTTEWYVVGAVIGIPICLIIIGVVLAVLYVRRRLY